MNRSLHSASLRSRRRVYFTKPPNAPRTIWPRMPPLRPLPKIASDASRTAMLVAVRAADFTIVVVIVSLRLAGVRGTGELGGGTGWASRRRGSGFGLFGTGGGVGALPHGPLGAGAGWAGGCAS